MHHLSWPCKDFAAHWRCPSRSTVVASLGSSSRGRPGSHFDSLLGPPLIYIQYARFRRNECGKVTDSRSNSDRSSIGSRLVPTRSDFAHARDRARARALDRDLAKFRGCAFPTGMHTSFHPGRTPESAWPHAHTLLGLARPRVLVL